MPNVYQPKLVQIRPQYDTNTDNNDHPENVLWFQNTNPGTPTAADLLQIANDFDGAWKTFWEQWGAAAKHYTGCVVTDWSSSTGLQHSTVGVFIPDAGAIAGATLPASCAVLMSYSNGQRFKGGHFRSYLPWVSSGILDTVDKNKIAAGSINAIGTGFGTMFSHMQAGLALGGQTMKLYRHRNNPATAALYDVVNYTCQPIIATQRRRLRRVAHH